MSKTHPLIQIRDGTGNIRVTFDMDEAITELVEERASKISWDGPEPYSRVILRVDRTWQYSAPDNPV